MQTRAAVARDYSLDMRLETVDLVEPGEGEVRVRIVASGVCHTDLKCATDPLYAPHPVVLGHEGSGVVEAVGPGVHKLAPGDHVVLTFASCGDCPSCRDAEPAYCWNQMPLNFGCKRPDGSAAFKCDGVPVYGDFFGQSSFASHAIANVRNAIKVRADAPLELLGPLGCGIQTGAGAMFNDLALKVGETVCVFGVGSLGLSAIMAAKVLGAGRIIAVDRHVHRLDLARELGADVTLVAGSDPVAPEVLKAVPGGVNVSFDTTGVGAVMLQAIDVLAPRGRMGFVTGPADRKPIPLHPRSLMLGRTMKGIIEGNSNPDVFIPLLVDIFMKGKFPFDKLVKFYPFADIVQAFNDVEHGTTVKPILRM